MTAIRSRFRVGRSTAGNERTIALRPKHLPLICIHLFPDLILHGHTMDWGCDEVEADLLQGKQSGDWTLDHAKHFAMPITLPETRVQKACFPPWLRA